MNQTVLYQYKTEASQFAPEWRIDKNGSDWLLTSYMPCVLHWSEPTLPEQDTSLDEMFGLL
jgi:hypothetical protein